MPWPLELWNSPFFIRNFVTGGIFRFYVVYMLFVELVKLIWPVRSFVAWRDFLVSRVSQPSREVGASERPVWVYCTHA